MHGNSTSAASYPMWKPYNYFYMLPFTWWSFCWALTVCHKDKNGVLNWSTVICHDRCLDICIHLREKPTWSFKCINIVPFMNNAQRLLIMKCSVKSIIVKFCEDQRFLFDACHIWHHIPQVSNCSMQGYADTNTKWNSGWIYKHCGDYDGAGFPLWDGQWETQKWIKCCRLLMAPGTFEWWSILSLE